MLLTILANNVMIAPVAPTTPSSLPSGVGKNDSSVYENQVRERKRRIARDNEIIFNVIKAFVECQG